MDKRVEYFYRQQLIIKYETDQEVATQTSDITSEEYLHAFIVRVDSLMSGNADSASAKLPPDEITKTALKSDHCTDPLQLPAVALPTASVFRWPVPQISKNREEGANSSIDCPDAHAASWSGSEQDRLRLPKLRFQPMNRMSGHIADGVHQSGVIVHSRLPEILQLHVVEKPSFLVDDSEVSVDAA